MTVAIAMCVGLTAPAFAQVGLTDAEKKEGGWVSLFDGTKKNRKQGWIVQGLEFTGPKVQEDEQALWFRGFDWWALISEKSYKNFTLRFDVMFDKEGGNSGVLLRTPKEKIYGGTDEDMKKNPDKVKQNREYKFEIQLVANAGEKPSKESSGAIFGALAPKSNPIKKALPTTAPDPDDASADEIKKYKQEKAKAWNSVEITLNQPKLKVTINGEVVQEIDISKTPGLPKLRPEGHIAFQYKLKKGKALYRNLRIKEL